MLMAESRGTAAFAAATAPSRAEHVQQIIRAARATLARCRTDEVEFRGRPAEVPGVSEARGPVTSGACPSRPAVQPQQQAVAAAWWAAIDHRIAQALAAEREQIFAELTDVIGSLRVISAGLDERLTAMETAMAEVRTTLAKAKPDDEEPLELPPLHSH
jgi:hypothetical protein